MRNITKNEANVSHETKFQTQSTRLKRFYNFSHKYVINTTVEENYSIMNSIN